MRVKMAHSASNNGNLRSNVISAAVAGSLSALVLASPAHTQPMTAQELVRELCDEVIATADSNFPTIANGLGFLKFLVGDLGDYFVQCNILAGGKNEYRIQLFSIQVFEPGSAVGTGRTYNDYGGDGQLDYVLSPRLLTDEVLENDHAQFVRYLKVVNGNLKHLDEITTNAFGVNFEKITKGEELEKPPVAGIGFGTFG